MIRCLRLATPIVALTFGCLSAQEARTWTDLKGRKLEGALVKQDDSTVWVRKGDGKEIAIPKASLSEDDRKHLATAPAPPPGAATAASSSGRFHTVRLDPSAWKPRPEGFKIGTLLYPMTLETEHFIIAGGPKVRAAMMMTYADACERLWADIAADIPPVKAAFEGRKLPVILADDAKDAEIFANWHEKHADASSTVSSSYSLTRSSIASFALDTDFSKEAGLTITGRLFRLDAKGAEHQRKTWPQRIHFLTGDIIWHLLSRANNNGEYSLALVKLSFNYHREELVCGKIESEVSFGGGTDVEGFKNGRNWAGATKKLLKGGATPDIVAFMKARGSDAEPRDLGFGLGLMHFIHAAPDRIAGFAKILETAGKDDKVPDPETFAKGLGFDSPEALNKAWKDYMLSDAFE
ncbi:hypothetical protein OKA05_19880 [Luteolibacter arcticus]|uniref:SLA1 homology domain-containing protein n=1 Tax=Luteolibacter arcticus TaxID=1581411 RepID=A0ABT3GMV7_9BACT|nr:hypothetical protein [Luteolibacter arcticus]MCW1924834.1 hypothetical protein [Luteolibacter arcticus]